MPGGARVEAMVKRAYSRPGAEINAAPTKRRPDVYRRDAASAA